VEIRHAADLVERDRPPRHAELVADRGEPRRVEIAEREHSEFRRELGIALRDMRLADAEPDHRDVEDAAHRPSAIACALSASSAAPKQRACGIAVSVRFRMSAMSW